MSKKKKIIRVVQSKPESSPSPEEHPSSPVSSRTDIWEREDKKSKGNSLSFSEWIQSWDLTESNCPFASGFKDKRDGWRG